jgi:hypothetical protein
MSDSIIPSELKNMINREINYCEKLANDSYNQGDKIADKNQLISGVYLLEGNLLLQIKTSLIMMRHIADSINGLATVIENFLKDTNLII